MAEVHTTVERLSRLAVLALVVFLLASVVHYQQAAVGAGRRRDAAIAALAATNDKIVAKLTLVFETAQRAEDAARAAGTVPATTVTAIVESLRGYVDPVLIQRAIDAAKKAVMAVATTTTTRTSTTTTVGSPTSTTNTTRPPVVTSTTTQAPTTSTSTTTTTRPCTLTLLGIRLLC